jgi:hypothetical protein
MKENIFFSTLIAIIVLHLVGLFVILDYNQQINESTINVMSQANVTVGDSITFEYYASLCTVIDMPEEHPVTGDTLCAYISNDTIYIQHYHNYHHQQWMFRYIHNN